MAKIMTQPRILLNNIVGAFARSTNVVGVERTILEEMKFQAMYNEEVNFLANGGSAYRQNTLDKMEIKVGVQMKDEKIEILSRETIIGIGNMGMGQMFASLKESEVQKF